MKINEPYFMTKESWYSYDLKSGKYVLTDLGKQNTEVVKSYDEFYSQRTDEEQELPPARP